MSPVLTAVTERVHLVQTSLVNWTLVSDGSGVMMIDAGFPGHRDDVLESLRKLGFEPEDVRAILLTHAHVDHFGTAIWFAKVHGTPVYCHADEVGHARREYLQQASPIDVITNVWRPGWVKWAAQMLGRGALVRDGIPTASVFSSEVGENLPGRPIAVPTPGHTGGHCSYIVDGVLVSGDALVTGHPLLSPGPQLLPELFNHSQPDCVRSLAALALVETDVLIPGHGDLWFGPIRKAAEMAAAPA